MAKKTAKKSKGRKKSTTKKKSPAKSAQAPEPHAMYRAMGWALLTGLWILLAASLISFDPADPPGHTIAPVNETANNWVGSLGANVSYRTYRMLGPGIWIVMAGWLTFLGAAAIGKPVSSMIRRFVGLLLMCVASSTVLSLSSVNAFSQPEGAGGLVAIAINSGLLPLVSVMGTVLLMTLIFLIGSIMAADQVVLNGAHHLGRLCMNLANVRFPRPVLVGAFDNLKDRFKRSKTDKPAKKKPKKTNKKTAKAKQKITDVDDAEAEIEAAGEEEWEYYDEDGNLIEDPDEEWEVEGELEEDEEEYEEEEYEEEEEVEAAADEEEEEAEAEEPTPDQLRAKIKQLPINFAPKQNKNVEPPREVDLSGYQFPGLDILAEPEHNFTAEQETVVREQAALLEEALTQYRIEGEVVGIDSGPVISLFEVRLSPGTKVSRVQSISSDLARSMKAHNIRIVPNTAGKDTVGIEVPNLRKEMVRLKELMTVENDKVAKMRLPMFLGKDASGNPLIQDLAAMPHMLIAGTTGSGKSVCMNSIIMSFLYTKKPDELKMVLVDPKMVEMSLFKDIPHLMCPVVTEMNKAAAILEWAVGKMDERYELLAEAGVRDIAGYNALTREELMERFEPATEQEEAKIPKKLPFLVFIIDELADLMMTNKEVENFIVRIAQKARAVGIHLILATQRPQANVVTGLIKGNMPCRIGFKVASGLDSRIVLDQKGAELLLGHGDMLFLSPRNSKLNRAQGTLVDDLEIRSVVKFLKNIATQNFEPQLMQLKQPGIDGDSGERDPLFDDAVRVVLESQRGSVSLLQRRLTIGYGRASRLIEEIGAAGIIGEYKGSQAREVNLSLEEWEALKAQAEADAAVEVNGNVDVDIDSVDEIDADEEIEYEVEDGVDEDEEVDEEDDEDAEVEDEYEEEGEEYDEEEYEEEDEEDDKAA